MPNSIFLQIYGDGALDLADLGLSLALLASPLLLASLLRFFGQLDIDVRTERNFELSQQTPPEPKPADWMAAWAAMAFMGWAMLSLQGTPHGWAPQLGAGIGAAAIGLFLCKLLRMLSAQIDHESRFLIENTRRKTGRVYLTVPANRSDLGSVKIRVQGGFRELKAMTEAGHDLAPGTSIVVEEIVNQDVLLVASNRERLAVMA